MRISKYYPISGIGTDTHEALSPSLPPTPPSPPNPVYIPSNLYIVINNCALGAVYGKWSMASVQTEGMGDVLWQYDWGPLQGHVATTPAVATPKQALLLIDSSTKYFLPSFSVKEKVEGGALQSIGGDDPVAVSTPAFLIPAQNCQDVAGVGFVLPTALCFQLVSTRWVAFTFGDYAAGLVGMAGDALSAAAGSAFGSMIPGDFGNSFMGKLTTSLIGQGIKVGTALTPGGKYVRTYAGAFLLGLGQSGAAGPMLTPLISDGANMLATEVGDTWGSQPPSEGGGASGSAGDAGGSNGGGGGLDDGG